MNPATYEMTEIQEAKNHDYTTTQADAGYLLHIRATGDGDTVGGYIQIFAQWETVIPNNASVNNVTNKGFTLNLDKTVDSLTVSDLTLRDKNWNTVEIASVTPGDNNAIFNIVATITADSCPLRLSNIRTNSTLFLPWTYYWYIASLKEGTDVLSTVKNLKRQPNVVTISAINKSKNYDKFRQARRFEY